MNPVTSESPSLKVRFLLGTVIFALLMGTAYCWYNYVHLNNLAEQQARADCAAKGAIEVVDPEAWEFLSVRSQEDRLSAPGEYGVRTGDWEFRKQQIDVPYYVAETVGYNKNVPVVRIRNPIAHKRTLFTDLGLVGTGAVFDCLRERPSEAREILLGF